MNKKDQAYSNDIVPQQMKRLQELINEVQRCCEDKRLYEARTFGIPYAEIKLLALFGSERYLTAMGIAERLDVAKSRVTKLVNSIFDKGLVQRTDDPKDARVKLLSLTVEGKKKAAEIEQFQGEIQARILGALEPEDRSRVIAGLELLRSAMREVKERLAPPENQ